MADDGCNEQWRNRLDHQRREKIITPELLLQHTEWPAADERIIRSPKLGPRLAQTRMEMVRFALGFEEKSLLDPHLLPETSLTLIGLNQPLHSDYDGDLTPKEQRQQYRLIRKFERIYQLAGETSEPARYRRASSNIDLIDTALEKLKGEGYTLSQNYLSHN